jgi:hypothetical protein
VQGVQHTQAELGIVMPKIPNKVKTEDNMVGGVDSLKYSDHDVSDATKFPYLAAQSYLESRGEGPSGAPLLEPAQWILGLYNTDIMNLLDIPHFGQWETHKRMCQIVVSEGAWRHLMDG